MLIIKHAYRYWTPSALKEELSLDLDISDIQEKLEILSEADMIDRGVSDIQFRGLSDGTLNLIIQNRFEEEIHGVVPDLKQVFNEQIKDLKAENRSLRGKLNCNQPTRYFNSPTKPSRFFQRFTVLPLTTYQFFLTH